MFFFLLFLGGCAFLFEQMQQNHFTNKCIAPPIRFILPPADAFHWTNQPSFVCFWPIWLLRSCVCSIFSWKNLSLFLAVFFPTFLDFVRQCIQIRQFNIRQVDRHFMIYISGILSFPMNQMKLKVAGINVCWIHLVLQPMPTIYEIVDDFVCCFDRCKLDAVIFG